MKRASAVSLQLARFDTLRKSPEVAGALPDGTLFCAIGADSRAAGTDPTSGEAFTFALLGLHADESSARAVLATRRTLAPWFDEAACSWNAVLRPFRHKGALNWLHRADPGLAFEASAAPASTDPFVAITTVGWNITPELDRSRIVDFGTGVLAIRASMSGIDGLSSQQAFFVSAGISFDPFTVSFWRDDAAVRAFAFAPGEHRHQMDRYHERNNADRTSFTRLAVVESHGTWRGRSPLTFGAAS